MYMNDPSSTFHNRKKQPENKPNITESKINKSIMVQLQQKIL